MPCPHFDVKVIQRSKRQSAVASAAYQSGERLFSEYDQKQKYYSHKSEIVHTEIMLPPHAPPEYADRNTLWNAAEAIEKQWNSQLARGFVLAIPRELPPEQYADLIRDYCREFFVSKGICFGAAAVVGVPLFFVLRDTAGNSGATLGMMAVMLPMFFLAMYQKNGQPAEKILRYYFQARFVRPKVRPYKTNNYYAILMKGGVTHDSVSEKE